MTSSSLAVVRRHAFQTSLAPQCRAPSFELTASVCLGILLLGAHPLWAAGAVLAILGLVLGYTVCRLPSSPVSVDRFRGLELAHRGGYGLGPENTLLTILRSLEQGARGIEVDVQLSKEGVPVLFHDVSLQRLCGCSERVHELSVEELKALPILDEDGSETGARIATVEELFEILNVVAPDLVIELDLKHFVPDPKRLVDEVTALLSEHEMHERVLLSSFNPKTLFKVRRKDARALTGFAHTERSGEGPLMDWALNRSIVPLFLGVAVIEPYYRLADSGYVRTWGRRGLLINAWTVNRAEDKARLLSQGVSVTTNYPNGSGDDRLEDAYEKD